MNRTAEKHKDRSRERSRSISRDNTGYHHTAREDKRGRERKRRIVLVLKIIFIKVSYIDYCIGYLSANIYNDILRQ